MIIKHTFWPLRHQLVFERHWRLRPIRYRPRPVFRTGMQERLWREGLRHKIRTVTA